MDIYEPQRGSVPKPNVVPRLRGYVGLFRDTTLGWKHPILSGTNPVATGVFAPQADGGITYLDPGSGLA